MLLLDPASKYADCIIGEDYYGSKVVYDAEKVIKVLMTMDEMTEEEALEYFEFNIVGAYVGEETPLFIWKTDGWNEDRVDIIGQNGNDGDHYE